MMVVGGPSNSRFPPGMTERKATATALARLNARYPTLSLRERMGHPGLVFLFWAALFELGVFGVGALVGFDDVEGEAAAVLHAGGAEDGAEGAGGAALFADDFADV